MRAAVAAIVVGAALAAPAATAPPPTKVAGVLTVGLAMPSAGFQIGSVKGRDVVLAKGLEIDLARAVAAKLGISRVRFLNEAYFSTLLRAGRKDWDIALAEISISDARARRVDFSVPYLRVDQGVLVRPGLSARPRSIADLRNLQLCAERATTGGLVLLDRVKPARKPLMVANPSQLSYDLFAKRCDAIVADAPALAVLRRQAPDRYGPLVGRIVTNEKYAAALEKGSALRPQINAALTALTKNGTITRLRKRWLGADTSTLPVLR